MKTRHSVLRFFLFPAALLSIAAISPARANTVWYVKPGGGTAPQTGLSWAHAFPTVEQAIAAASPTRDALGKTDEVWCAEGLYTPPVTVPPPPALPYSNGFIINKSLKLYGGFKGTENNNHARLGSFKRTYLDGNINNPSLYTDNAFHVVNITGVLGYQLDPGVLIDGFVIRNGYATGAGVNGAGILSNVSDLDLANCYFRSNYAAPGTNYGGGLYFTSLVGGGVEPTVANLLRIKNSEFEGNHGWEGGAIYGNSVRGEIVNTKIFGSESTLNGAGVYLARMGPSNWLDFTSCVFYDNSCTGQDVFGGGLYLGPAAGLGSGGKAKLVNCTFAANECGVNSITHLLQAGQAMGVSSGSQALVYNSILYWNNTTGPGGPAPVSGPATVDWSDVEGGWIPMANNLNSDPKFVNLPGGDLSLQLTPTASDCIDAADYSQLPLDNLDVDGDGITTGEIIPWDIAWQGRWFDQLAVLDHGVGLFSFLDMGAYERH